MSDTKSYPKKMKAVFLDGSESRLVVKEIRTPDPGPGDVLVKMSAAPVNPSDLARIKDAISEYDLASYVPGLEGSGRVVAAGKGILPGLWLGKRVACTAKHFTSGTWAEYMATSATNCFPLGRKISDEQGSMLLVNPLTALAFLEIAKQNKHKAIINNAAASALGRMIELLGKKHGIPVINIVRSQKQVEMLRQHGSGYILDSSDPSFIEDFGRIAHDLSATLLLDSVCSRELELMCDALPPDSTILVYGNLSGEEKILFKPRTLILNNINISGFYLGARAKKNSLFRNMMNLRKVSSLMSKELKISIQGRFPLARAQEAVDTYLANMSAGKTLIVMNMQ